MVLYYMRKLKINKSKKQIQNQINEKIDNHYHDMSTFTV